jgi:hypothetical protein
MESIKRTPDAKKDNSNKLETTCPSGHSSVNNKEPTSAFHRIEDKSNEAIEAMHKLRVGQYQK